MNDFRIVYLYLISPLHTGGTSQEGNLLGIARESHTDLPYIPSSTIRGRLRANAAEESERTQLFGTELTKSEKLEQGSIWVGDGSVLWLPVPSLSHGVIWVSCPFLLQRWARFQSKTIIIPEAYSTSFGNDKPVYLKDAILKKADLRPWQGWESFVPRASQTNSINRLMVLPDQHCATLIQMSLWRQVKVKLDEHKTVDGGFRYEEAIPPDTLMYYPWGTTTQVQKLANTSQSSFIKLLKENDLMQIGGQESLGRGFVQQWLSEENKNETMTIETVSSAN
jgi:CRISPR-associated protein Cmr4